jgi:enoyl-CoA hydratase/carnithine racemase
MEYHDLIVERDQELMKVTLNRPEARNTMSLRLMTELEDLAGQIQQDRSIRAVVLTGAAANFSAGLDLKDPALHEMLSASVARRREMAMLGQRLCQVWEDLEAVTMAAIEGYCVGGAVSLVLALDFRIMGRSAFVRIPEIDLGMNYSWGSIPRLVHLIGPARAKLMVLTTRRVAAERCLAWGLTEEVVPDGSALPAAMDLARTILEKPPVATAMTKLAVNRLATALDKTASFMDADQFVLTTYSQEHQNIIADYVNRHKPKS